MSLFRNLWMGMMIIIFSILLLTINYRIRVNASEKKDSNFIIAIDPGHGSDGSGASSEMDGEIIHEEKLNLKIAEYLKDELETYSDVKVILTRDDSYDVDLLERTMIAVRADADVMISIHNNAIGPDAEYDKGSTVLVARGQYKEDMALEEQELGASILYELSRLGLQDNGLLVRDSTNGETYDNDAVADYYAIIRNGIKNDLPSVIIEHAFLDNADDYHNYLSDDESLNEIACADARGIARYFHLNKIKGENTLDDLSNYEESFLYMVDDNVKHNQHYTKIFFETEETEKPDVDFQKADIAFSFFKLSRKNIH